MDRDADFLPEFCTAETLILCCGNILFGDDGFGPEVAKELTLKYSIPPGVCIVDAGTGARKLLFTLCLGTHRPKRIVVVDAVDLGRKAGELFEISLQEIPPAKLDDFSLHQVPTSNILYQLQQSGIEVRILVCQTSEIPNQIQSGLSESVRPSVSEMCRKIAREYLLHAEIQTHNSHL